MNLWKMVGALSYYHSPSKNPANTWLVKKIKTRSQSVPDIGTICCFTAEQVAVKAIQIAGGMHTETEIAALSLQGTRHDPEGRPPGWVPSMF